jgi:hypothetical protein
LKAALDRPEEGHLVGDSTRAAIEEQIMAYLTVRNLMMHIEAEDEAESLLQANSDHLSSYLTSQRMSNMLDVSLQVPIVPRA